jgi:hypothetical protein
MSLMNRRESFQTFFQGLLHTAGTVVLASSALPARAAGTEADPSGNDIERRANQVAEGQGGALAGETEYPVSFVNGRFINGGGGGGFRNAGFHNGGGGGFRNAGFANGGFGNGGFKNGAFHNGGFVNGGFRNGAFANGGFRNF